MSTAALITMLSAWTIVTVTLAVLYFKVLRSKK
jgi:hypothetical protein